MHPLVERLHELNPTQVLIVNRHFPLPGHANAMPAARAAEAAGRQGQFAEMTDLLFQNQAQWSPLANPQATFESYAQLLGLNLNQFRSDMADPAIDARILRDRNSGNTLGVSGTPTFFLNGQEIPFPQSVEQLQARVDAAIVEAQNASPAMVTVQPINGSSARVRVVTDPGFAGQFEVRVAARDNFHTADASAFAFQDVTVNVAVNQRPQATGQIVSITCDEPVPLTLGGNDGDPTMDQALTFVLDSLPPHGTLTDLAGNPVAVGLLLASSGLRYQPSGCFAGDDQFQFHVRDDGGTAGGGQDTSLPATVTLRVIVNQAPNANSQTVQFRPGLPANIQLAGDDGDPDAIQALSYEIVSLPANGTLTDSNANAVAVGVTLPTNRLTYMPNAGSSGEDQFQFRVRDDGGVFSGGQDTSQPATVTLQVRGVEPAGETPVPRLRRGVLAIRGSSGDDIINCFLSANGTNIEVTVNDSETETFQLSRVRVIHIRTGAGDDVITIDPEVQITARIRCGRGDDEATGGSGADWIRGGAGADSLDGAAGNDHLYGGLDNDSLDGGDGDDRIRGDDGDDSIDGGDGHDRVRGGMGNDSVLGSEGDDRMRGGRGSDSVDGGAGNDRMRGGRGHDSLLGAAGVDLILGQWGRDILSGGAGSDTLRGGPGRDTDEDEDPLDILRNLP